MRPLSSLSLLLCLALSLGCRPTHHQETLPQSGPISSLAHYSLFDNPGSTLETWWRENRLEQPEKAEQLQRLLGVPTAIWVREGTSAALQSVRRAAQLAAQERRLPVFCIYNIVERDINQFSKGGAKDAVAYREFLRQLDRALGVGPALLILEPDSLGQLSQLSESKQAERLALLRDAVTVLGKNPQRRLYLDGAHSDWHGPETQAKLLQQAGIAGARGFAVNVSNFQSLNGSLAYVQAVSRLTGGKTAVIDTSRCGNGPAPDKRWCNPPGRALGPLPTTNVHGCVDALLWIKLPWESDGEQDGAPSAGAVYPNYALELVHNAGGLS